MKLANSFYSPQLEKPPTKPPEKQVDRAEVLFDYTAEQADELSIRVGEILEVVSKEVEEGWWEVGWGVFERGGQVKDITWCCYISTAHPHSLQSPDFWTIRCVGVWVWVCVCGGDVCVHMCVHVIVACAECT